MRVKVRPIAEYEPVNSTTAESSSSETEKEDGNKRDDEGGEFRNDGDSALDIEAGLAGSGAEEEDEATECPSQDEAGWRSDE